MSIPSIERHCVSISALRIEVNAFVVPEDPPADPRVNIVGAWVTMPTIGRITSGVAASISGRLLPKPSCPPVMMLPAPGVVVGRSELTARNGLLIWTIKNPPPYWIPTHIYRVKRYVVVVVVGAMRVTGTITFQIRLGIV